MTLVTGVSVWIVLLLVPLWALWSSWRQRASGTLGAAASVAGRGARGRHRDGRVADGTVVRAEPLLNVSERTVFEQLTLLLAGTGFRAMPSVRLLDFLDVSGEDRAATSLRYALMGHVDVLIVDGRYRPVLVLEIDGPLHAAPKQARRDRVKDDALRAAGVPLLRLPARGRRSGEELQRLLAPYLKGSAR